MTRGAAADTGIAVMEPLYVFEGYTIDHPWVIVLALAHDYERLREVPDGAWTMSPATLPARLAGATM